MATEGPNIHDGTNVANANYAGGAGLAGPGGSAQFLGMVLSQAVDRTLILGSVQGAQIYGVCQNKPPISQAVDVVIFGLTKAVAAAAGVTRGKPQMMTATGAFTDWVAGAANAQVGWALESAVSGAIFTMNFCATPPKVLT